MTTPKKQTKYRKEYRAQIRKERIAAAPRRVDFFEDADDHTVAMMGSLGFSNLAIMEKTGLSMSQITYRLNKGGIKRMDYRDGSSAIAKAIFRQNSEVAEPILRKQLEKRLKDIGAI